MCARASPFKDLKCSAGSERRRAKRAAKHFEGFAKVLSFNMTHRIMADDNDEHGGNVQKMMTKLMVVS